MRLLLTTAAVLTGTEPARADMGLPFDRDVPARVTVTADPQPGVVLFIIRDVGPTRQLPTTAPVVLDFTAGARYGFSIFAVPEAVVRGWPAGVPPPGWSFGSDNPDARFDGRGGALGRVSFGDSRAVVEQRYRVTQTGGGMRVVRVSENEGSLWYRGASALGCCCGLPVGIAWLGVWAARRLFPATPAPRREG